MIGKLLGNRYQILEQLGGGGMAIIYKGRDTFLNRFVTIKVPRPEFTSDEEFVRRFSREAQAIARLSHPNIVSIFDVGREGDVPYLVMEYVEGDNLKNLIRTKGAISPPEKAVQIAGQVLDALQHAHDNNIVHRDIKPHNILITTLGAAKLTDFGIAREATTTTLTQSDTIVGSVHYLSPEQARGETAGPRSDIYSLGVVLYEMVTGVLPFKGDTPISVAIKHIQDEPLPPSRVNPAVSPELENVIIRAMAKNPADRFETARQMAQALPGASHGGREDGARAINTDEFATRVLPLPEVPGQKTVEGKKRRPAWLWAVMALVALMALGIAAFQIYINVPEVNMPAVEGKPLEDAQNALMAKGLKHVQIIQSSHPSAWPGTVYDQDPPADTPVKVTRNIVLKVSLGPETRTVPSVIGLTLNDAKAKIFQNELFPAEPVQEVYSSEYAQGTVVDQEPRPDARATKGSRVSLFVSKGAQAKRQVPDLVGLTLDKARVELEKVKLKLDDKVSSSKSSDYFKGQVTAQNPATGTEVQEGSLVQVTVSDGPGPVKQTATVEVRMPDDKKIHQLRITVIDDRGTSDAYTGFHQSNEKVVRGVNYYGKAKIQVYFDNALVEEKQF